MFCLSNEFIANENCMKLFYMANNSMQKAIQIVLLGADMNWMKTTEIGMQLSAEVSLITFYYSSQLLWFNNSQRIYIRLHSVSINELRQREIQLLIELKSYY